MLTIDNLRQIVQHFPEVTESPHFEKISFRVKNKIFITYDEHNHRACIKLSLTDQDVFAAADKKNVYPVNNKWGTRGWTYIEMSQVHSDLFIDAVTTAYCDVAPLKLGQIARNNCSDWLPQAPEK